MERPGGVEPTLYGFADRHLSVRSRAHDHRSVTVIPMVAGDGVEPPEPEGTESTAQPATPTDITCLYSKWWAEEDSNLRCFCVRDLQSPAFAARHIDPLNWWTWSGFSPAIVSTTPVARQAGSPLYAVGIKSPARRSIILPIHNIQS